MKFVWWRGRGLTWLFGIRSIAYQMSTKPCPIICCVLKYKLTYYLYSSFSRLEYMLTFLNIFLSHRWDSDSLSSIYISAIDKIRVPSHFMESPILYFSSYLTQPPLAITILPTEYLVSQYFFHFFVFNLFIVIWTIACLGV